MLYGGIIGGRGKGRCPGSNDGFILFFSDSRWFIFCYWNIQVKLGA